MKKLFLIIFFLMMEPKVDAQQNVDSLLTIWNDEGASDTTRLNALKSIVFSYSFSQPDSTLYYAKEQYEFAKKRNLLFFMGSALNMQGIIYYHQADYSLALTYFHQTIEVLEEMIHNNDKVDSANYGMAGALLNCGNIYSQQGNFKDALKHFARAIPIFEKIGANAGKAVAQSNIALIYFEQNDFLKAVTYYHRVLNILKETNDQNDKLTLAVSLSGLGRAYTMLGEYQKSFDALEQALNISKEALFKNNIAFSLQCIGFNYQKQADYEKAIDYYMQSLELNKELSSKASMDENYRQIGEVYFKLGQYNLARKWCKKGLDLSKEVGRRLAESRLCKCLYDANKALGNPYEALEYHERMVILTDSLKIEETDKQLQQMEFSNQRLADSLAQVEKELTMEMAFQAELFEKDKTRNILIGLGLIALLLAGGFWSRNRYIRKTNAELSIAKNRAERSEQFKQQFLANMSHEIRTPMHAISGMVKILKRNEHLPAQDTFLNAMHTSSDNLVVILNDVLDLSKIEAGKLDIENIPMSPAAVIGNVSQILTYKAEEKGLQLNYYIDEEVPDLIMGDPTRLNQILINLTGNGIKFTEKGSVSISLNKKNDFMIYEVRDTGIGIAEDKLQSIFDAFGQAEGSTTRKFGGTGLGLSISQQLVELMGGNIWAESEMGKSSAFFVSLPLISVEGEVTDKQSLSEEQIMTLGAALSGKRILLAEDNEFNQMIAQDDLTYYLPDVQIDIAENGALALEKFQTGNYDLILMDVQMPEMDGYEATLKIREWEQANGKSPIPIIAMTASLLKSEVNLCLEAGMDNYVPKPYEAEELIGRMYEEVSTDEKLID